MHAISSIIAMILVLMITVALVGAAYVFLTAVSSKTEQIGSNVIGTTTTGLLAKMRIENASITSFNIRNIGTSTLTNFSVYVNDASANFNISPSVISPGQVGTIEIFNFLNQGDIITVSSAQGGTKEVVLPDPCNQAVLCLNFNEGQGSTTYDSSGNGNNGNLGTNVIPNPGFESGLWQSYDPAFWSLDSSSHSGAYDAKLSSSTVNCNSYQWVDLPVVQYKNYSISAWIKTNEPNATYYSAVGIANASSNWENFYLSPLRLTGTNDWTWVNLSNYNSSSFSNLRFFVTEQHCAPPTGTAWFDDVYAGWNIPSWSNGKYGSALNFNGDAYHGGSNESVTVPDSQSLNITGTSFTLSAWVYLNEYSKNSSGTLNNGNIYTPILERSVDWPGQHGYGLGVYDSQGHFLGLNLGWGTDVISNLVVSLNQWHFVAVSYSNSGTFVRFIVDNQINDSSNTGKLYLTAAPQDLHIGYNWWAYGGMYFNGTIDEVRIYDKAIY